MNQDPQPNDQPFTAPDNNPVQPTPPEPPKNKKKGLLIALIAVAAVVILGIVAFAMMNSGKKEEGNKTTDSSTTDSSKEESKFEKYDVTDATTGLTFSISFYKGAEVAEKNGRTFLNVGEEGSQFSAYLGANKEGSINCGDAPSTTMRLNGESTTICYKSDNTQYSGYVMTSGMTVQLNVAGQKAISMEDAKAIIESATFN